VGQLDFARCHLKDFNSTRILAFRPSDLRIFA